MMFLTSLQILLDSFTPATWACIVALSYGIVGWLLSASHQLLLVAPALVLLWKFADMILMIYGFRVNNWASEVLEGPTTAVNTPGEEATSGPDGQIVVFLVGARVNRPLGVLAPGVQKVVAYFSDMNSDLEKRWENFGMLGSSS